MDEMELGLKQMENSPPWEMLGERYSSSTSVLSEEALHIGKNGSYIVSFLRASSLIT